MSLGVGIYVKDSISAVKTYIRAFGLELGYHMLNSNGTYFHSELMKNGEPVVSVVEADRNIVDSPVQLGYFFETREELEAAVAILREGGKVLMDIRELPWSPCAAEIVDRFGVDWFLSLPNHRPPEDFKAEDFDG